MAVGSKQLKCKTNKHVYDLYAENYKILIKEIKEDPNKWRHTVFMNRGSKYSKNVNSP